MKMQAKSCYFDQSALEITKQKEKKKNNKTQGKIN